MSHWNPYQPFEDGLPPQEVRLISLQAEPWPDSSQRVRILLEITPFLQRPNIEVTIFGTGDTEISNVHIIETIETHMTFTMHLKGSQKDGLFTLQAKLFYPDTGIVDEKKIPFEIFLPGTPAR
jgi:hypothetical protein